MTFLDILLNVFLAIAVDNLADVQTLTDEQEEQLRKCKRRQKAARKRMENHQEQSGCETSEVETASHVNSQLSGSGMSLSR